VEPALFTALKQLFTPFMMPRHQSLSKVKLSAVGSWCSWTTHDYEPLKAALNQHHPRPLIAIYTGELEPARRKISRIPQDFTFVDAYTTDRTTYSLDSWLYAAEYSERVERDRRRDFDYADPNLQRIKSFERKICQDIARRAHLLSTETGVVFIEDSELGVEVAQEFPTLQFMCAAT